MPSRAGDPQLPFPFSSATVSVGRLDPVYRFRALSSVGRPADRSGPLSAPDVRIASIPGPATGGRYSFIVCTAKRTIRAVPSALSPEQEQSDKPVRSNTRVSVHYPSLRVARKVRPRPNEIPYRHSIPVLAGLVSALRSELVLRPQDGSDPKIAALDGQQFVPMCFHLAFASRLRESVPKPPALPRSFPGSSQGAVRPRTIPAGNPGKSETGAIPFVEHPNWRQRPQKTRLSFAETEL